MEEPKPNQIQTLQGEWIDMPPSADAELITDTPKTLLEEALEQVEGYTRRISALETRIAALEAALDKLTGEK